MRVTQMDWSGSSPCCRHTRYRRNSLSLQMPSALVARYVPGYQNEKPYWRLRYLRQWGCFTPGFGVAMEVACPCVVAASASRNTPAKMPRAHQLPDLELATDEALPECM